MTMEWVEGARLSDRAMLDTYGLEPSRLVDTMVRILIQQAYESNYYIQYPTERERFGRSIHE